MQTQVLPQQHLEFTAMLAALLGCTHSGTAVIINTYLGKTDTGSWDISLITTYVNLMVEGIIKVRGIRPLGTMNVGKFHCNPFNSCWDNSVLTKEVDWQADNKCRKKVIFGFSALYFLISDNIRDNITQISQVSMTHLYLDSTLDTHLQVWADSNTTYTHPHTLTVEPSGPLSCALPPGVSCGPFLAICVKSKKHCHKHW